MPTTTTTTSAKLSPLMARWLRAAAREHEALQARDYDRAELYSTKRMPVATRDALIARGLYAEHTVTGMGGGFRYFRITDAGIAEVSR